MTNNSSIFKLSIIWLTSLLYWIGWKVKCFGNFSSHSVCFWHFYLYFSYGFLAFWKSFCCHDICSMVTLSQAIFYSKITILAFSFNNLIDYMNYFLFLTLFSVRFSEIVRNHFWLVLIYFSHLIYNNDITFLLISCFLCYMKNVLRASSRNSLNMRCSLF